MAGERKRKGTGGASVSEGNTGRRGRREGGGRGVNIGERKQWKERGSKGRKTGRK